MLAIATKAVEYVVRCMLKETDCSRVTRSSPIKLNDGWMVVADCDQKTVAVRDSLMVGIEEVERSFYRQSYGARGNYSEEGSLDETDTNGIDSEARTAHTRQSPGVLVGRRECGGG